ATAACKTAPPALPEAPVTRIMTRSPEGRKIGGRRSRMTLNAGPMNTRPCYNLEGRGGSTHKFVSPRGPGGKDEAALRMSGEGDAKRSERKMESAGGLATGIRAKAVRGAAGPAAGSHREGADLAVTPVAGRWCVAPEGDADSAAASDV